MLVWLLPVLGLVILWLWGRSGRETKPHIGRAVLVTGAASGIGRAVAEYFLAQGCVVFALDRDLAGLKAAYDGNANAMYRKVDVSVAEEVMAAADWVRQQGRSLWGVVSNAGIANCPAALVELQAQELRRILEVNVLGAAHVAQAFFPLLRESRGVFVFTGSATAMVQTGCKGLYEASKCAVRGFANSLRVEIEPLGVSVCLIEPGGVQTDMGNTMFAEPKPSSLLASYFTHSRKVFRANSHRILLPQHLAPIYFDCVFRTPPPPEIYIAAPLEQVLFLTLRRLPTRWKDYLVRKIFYGQ